MTETVLVTGGAGYLGVPLVRELTAQGYRPVVVDDFSVAHRARVASTGAEVIEVDITDHAAITVATDECRPSVVVHLAARHFIPWCEANPDAARAINVDGTRNVVDACVRSGVERLFFASTADVYLPSTSPHRETDDIAATSVYGQSKIAGEGIVTAAPMSTVVARLFNIYGPGDTNPHVLPDIMRAMRLGDELALGNTLPKRDYVYVDDMASAVVGLVAASPSSTVVNVGTGHAYSVDELVEALAVLSGRPLRIAVDPAKLRPSDRPILSADRSRLHSLLPNWEPRSLEEGLTELLRSEGLMQSV